MKLALSDTSAVRKNLLWLSAIRHIALGGLIFALVFFTYVQNISLPSLSLGQIIAVYAVVIFISWRRCFWQLAITQHELFAHILIDIIFLSLLFYFSGGASNPFVSFYLVPVSVAAATLPKVYAWATAIISLAAYSLLLKYHVVIDALQPSHHGGGLNLHLVGMWVNFALSALLITFFVARMALSIRQQTEQISQQREQQLHNEQLLAVATLAAGTAHELGTPLNSIKLLSENMLLNSSETDSKTKDLITLNAQVDECRAILQGLINTAQETNQTPTQQSAYHYFQQLLERWQLMRPQVNTTIQLPEQDNNTQLRLHPSISQSIISLINNAADASPNQISINIRWDNKTAYIDITDYGTGIDDQQLKHLATPFLTDKPDGMGLGLFLSKTSLDRYGGTVNFSQHKQGGTQTSIKLPLVSQL